ncbi:hypothetical protein NECID01_0861 [Nematocida sp. AWRm77]|nr:hypothetical protein NECID01_0861 [Nematocida sp. AWRm77]
MTAFPCTSTMLRSIKSALKDICRHSVLIMPAERITEHPCDWLGKEMQEALEVLERTKRKLEEEVAQKRDTVQTLQAQKESLEKALNRKHTAGSFWVHKNLTVKEGVLCAEIAELEKEHAVQKQEFESLKAQIQEINEEVGVESTQAVLQYSGLVHSTHIEECRAELKQAQERLESVRKETKERAEKIEKLAVQIGLPCIEYTKLEECIKETEKYFCMDKPAPQALSAFFSAAQAEEAPEQAHRPKLTRRVFESLVQLEILGSQCVDRQQRRAETLKTRAGKSAEVGEKRSLIGQSMYLAQQIEELEETYKAQIKEIFGQNLSKVQAYTEKIEELTGEPKQEAKYEEICTLTFSEQEALLEEIEAAAQKLEQECTILVSIKEFIQERKALLQKMAAFEEQARDPSRLFRSSFQLISEEKFRKMAVPALLRVEKEIFSLTDEYVSLFAKDPLIGQVPIVQELQHEVSSRIINTSVFMAGKSAKGKTPPSKE